MTLQIAYFTTRDGISIRWGYTAADVSPGRGTVLLLNGRTEYMEKYQEVFAALRQRGYAVYSCDWRGQGLSGRMLSDSQKGYVRRFDDYLEDLDQLMGIVRDQRPPSPFIIIGHSMGGHLALRFIERQPGLFERGVVTAPMIDIQVPFFLPRRLLRWLVHLAVDHGKEGDYILGTGGFGDRDRRYDGNPLTSDRARFQRNVDMIQQDPRLALGGVTYGWLAAALASIKWVTSPAFVQSLELPLLMVTASEERIVSRDAQERFYRQAPDCRLVSIEGARHELLVETDERQAQFWEVFDRFVMA